MKIIQSVLFLLGLASSGLLLAEPVNINTASAVEIAESLNGIGEARAAAIVTFREQNGPFMSAEQLLEVKGVGEKIFEKSRADIMVKSVE